MTQRRTYSLWLSSFRRFTRGVLTLLSFLLRGIAGAGKFEKFVGEVAIGFGHVGGECEERTEHGLGVGVVVTVGVFPDNGFDISLQNPLLPSS